MRSAQRSVRAYRQHPQRSTRQIIARHRSADLPGQADGSHKPCAAYAAPTPNHRRASASHSECSECSESSKSSKKRPPTAPPSEHTHLESPCRRAAAPSKPNFHHLHYDTTLPAIRAIRIIRVPDCFTRPAIRAPAACVAPHKFAIFRLFWNLSAPPFTKILHFYFATAFIFTNFAADLFITHI